MKRFLIILGFILLVMNVLSVQLSDVIDNSQRTDFRDSPPPSPTTPQIPAITAQEVTEYPMFSWNQATGELTTYKFYLGTDGEGEISPTNLVNGLDVGLALSYYPDIELALDQTYYWQVVPTHYENGDALDCPIWSFKTKAQASDSVPYRQFFENSNNFTGNLTTTSNGGTQSTGGIVSSARSGAMVSTNSFGPITDESQLVFYYRLPICQLSQDLIPDDSFLAILISYDKVNYETVDYLSIFDPLNNQYNKITIDLDDYPGAYYIKFQYNLYLFFYDQFLGISPEIFIDNFFVRENNLTRELDVSPPSWDAGETAKNNTSSQEVTITNLSTYQISIENLGIFNSIFTLHYFSMTDYQSSFTLPEGYRQTFTVNYTPLDYGNHSTNVTYEIAVEGSSAADPTIDLMTLTGSCTNPYISTYPYIQDFEEPPFVNWLPSSLSRHLDSNDNYSWCYASLDEDCIIEQVVTPFFDLNEETIVQFTLRKLDTVVIDEPVILNFRVINTETFTGEIIYCSNLDNPIIHYDNNILINSENRVSIIIPQSYANHRVKFAFILDNQVDDSILIDDFKVLSGDFVSPVALEEPEVEVRQQSGYPVLHWEHVNFADSYLIEASDDLSSSTWIPLTITPYQGYVYTGEERFKFFRVKAIRSDE